MLQAVLQVVARRGQALFEDPSHPTAKLADDIRTVLDIGLALAAEALGQRLDRSGVGPVLALFLDLWARGGLPSSDAAAPAVREAFAAFAEQVTIASYGRAG